MFLSISGFLQAQFAGAPLISGEPAGARRHGLFGHMAADKSARFCYEYAHSASKYESDLFLSAVDVYSLAREVFPCHGGSVPTGREFCPG